MLYLLGLSLRLVLRARKGLCSCLSSNGSRALERKPCRVTEGEERYEKIKKGGGSGAQEVNIKRLHTHVKGFQDSVT